MVEGALESVIEVNPWMDWCTNEFTIDKAKEFIQEQIIAKKNNTAYEFALFNTEGLYLGGGGVNNISKQCNFANIGYWIRTSETKKGYGTAALKALINWARINTELNRLEVVVATGNYASNRVATKCRAVLEGTAKCRLYNNGQYLDANIYSFTKNV
jgi:RimJ/RimL family protein N-acetyltransferase